MLIFAALTIVVVMKNFINLLGIELQPVTGLPSVLTLPDFTQFQFTHFQNSAFFLNNKKYNNNIVEKHSEFFAWDNESVRRQKWRKNAVGR